LDDCHIEAYAFVGFIIGFLHPFFWIVMCIYLYVARRVIRFHLLIVLCLIGFVMVQVKSNHQMPDQIHGVASVVDIEPMKHTNRLTVSFEGRKYHLFSNQEIKLGNRYIIDANVDMYRNQTVPKGFDAYLYYFAEGIDGKLKIHEMTYVDSGFHINELRLKLIENVKDLRSQSIVLSIVFGETDFDEEATERYRMLGIMYLFSMSGLHIYVIIEGLKKWMFHLDLSPRIQSAVIILFLLCALYLYQGSHVILRILLMMILYQISQKYQFSWTGLDRIQMAFFLMILFDYRLLWHLGFFMTYIILNVIHLSEYLYRNLSSYTKKVVLTSIIQCLILPFTRLLSPMMMPLFPIIQLVIIYVVTPLSFLVIFFPFLDEYLMIIMTFFDDLMLWLSDRQMSMMLPSLSVILIFVYLIAFISLLTSKNIISMTWKVIIIILIFYIPSLRFLQPDQVVFIDVGQGDAIYIQSDDCQMLIDAYKGSYNYLEHHGIRSLDLLILTHSDTDHTYDAIEIIDKLNINQIVLSAYDTYDFYRYQGVLFVKSNDKIACGNTWIDVLGPIKDYPNSNDRSIVLQIKMMSMTFLLTGDIEEQAELDLIERYGNLLKSDVLKVSHHGSITSSSEAFLETVMPKYAIISAGYQNRYHFPDPTILSRLMKQDVSIFRTDIQGTIICNLNEKRPKWKIHLPYQH